MQKAPDAKKKSPTKKKEAAAKIKEAKAAAEKGNRQFCYSVKLQRKVRSGGKDTRRHYFHTNTVIKWIPQLLNEEKDEAKEYESFKNIMKNQMNTSKSKKNMKDINFAFFLTVVEGQYYVIVFNSLKANAVILDNENDNDYNKYKDVFDSVVSFLVFFYLKINHGGTFITPPMIRYKGGKVNWVDDIDSDIFSIVEVTSMMKELGYDNPCMAYYYKKPKKDLDNGLTELDVDKDVCEMLIYVDNFKVIELYTDHFVNKKHAFIEEPLVFGTTSEPNEPDTGSSSEAEVDVSSLVGVSKQKVFRAKKMAYERGVANYTQQYAQLRDYYMELKERNPNTTVKIEVERPEVPDSQERKFKRIYVCLGPLKDGFRAGGRDFLGLDGCFLSGPYPDQILTAVGVDPNNGIYPLAFALVESENKDS
ncbi:hypothetical protein Tco_0795306 [Tanacetum coccineum]